MTRFLESANYLPSYVPKIIELVNCHHDYDKPKNKLLQLLMEADLIVNCYENRPDHKKAEYIKKIFQTETRHFSLHAPCTKIIKQPWDFVN